MLAGGLCEDHQESCGLKTNGLKRDHFPAQAISISASVRVQSMINH